MTGEAPQASLEFPGFRGTEGLLFDYARGVTMSVGDHEHVDLAMGFGVYLHGHAAQEQLLARPDSAVLAPGLGDLHATTWRDRACRAVCELAAAGGMAAAGEDLRALLLLTGSEAVETAIKTALLATGRTRIVAFDGGYHGTFGLALAATWRPAFREPFAAQYGASVTFAPYGAVPSLDGQVACVVVEPVQGRAGVIEPPPGFLAALRDACDEVGALLIVDSVLVGCGRTGVAAEGAGVQPHLLCLGKALGAGIPASAVVARRDVAEAAWGGTTGEVVHTATFLGHPLSCAAVLRVLGELLPAAPLAAESQAWAGMLPGLAEATGLSLRGRGLLWALDTGRAGGGVELARRLLHEHRLVVAPSGPTGSSVTLTPALVEGDRARAALATALPAAL